MQIQVHTDSSIQGGAGLVDHVTTVVSGALDRFTGRLSRVEVHLSDENGDKNRPDDKKCLLEARVEGRSPTVVSHNGNTVDEAVNGATDKMLRVLDTTFGKLNAHNHR